MFCNIYGAYFELYLPHKAEGLLSGQNILDSPTKLFIASLAHNTSINDFSYPNVKTEINQNIEYNFRSFFSLFVPLVAISSFLEWRIFYIFLSSTEMIITVFGVWNARNWKREIKQQQNKKIAATPVKGYGLVCANLGNLRVPKASFYLEWFVLKHATAYININLRCKRNSPTVVTSSRY